MAINYRKSEVVSGAFILVAVFVFCAFAFKVGGLDPFVFLQGEKKTFVTVFPDIQTLDVGAKVAIGGRRIGRVSRVEYGSPQAINSVNERFMRVWGRSYDDIVREQSGTVRPVYRPANPPRILVWFEVEEEEVQAATKGAFMLSGGSARVLLVQEGFLGGHFVQIHPGPESMVARPGEKDLFGSDLAEWGDDEESAIPLIGMEAGLMQLFEEKIDPTLARVNELLDKVNTQILSTDNLEHIESVIQGVDKLVKDSNALLQDIRPLFEPQNPASLQRQIVEPARSMLLNLDGTIDGLREDLRSQVIAKLSGFLDNGNRTLEVARSTLRSVDGLIAKGEARLIPILDNLKVTAGNLEVRLDRLQGNVDEVVDLVLATVKNANGILSDNRPELAEVMTSLRRTMWEAEMAMRKIRSDPSVLLLGDDEVILGTNPFDRSGLRRSGRAAPYRQRDENEKK